MLRVKKALPKKRLIVAASLAGAVLLGGIFYGICYPSYSKYEVTLTDHPQTKVSFDIPIGCEVGAVGSARHQEFFTLQFAPPSPVLSLLTNLFHPTGLPETISSDEVRIWVDDLPDTFTHDQIKSMKSRAFIIRKMHPKVQIAAQYVQEEVSDRIITMDRFEYREFNGVPFLYVIYQVYAKHADGKYSRLIDTDFCLPKDKGSRFDTALRTILATAHATANVR